MEHTHLAREHTKCSTLFSHLTCSVTKNLALQRYILVQGPGPAAKNLLVIFGPPWALTIHTKGPPPFYTTPHPAPLPAPYTLTSPCTCPAPALRLPCASGVQRQKQLLNGFYCRNRVFRPELSHHTLQRCRPVSLPPGQSPSQSSDQSPDLSPD